MVLEHLFEGFWLALGILWATTRIPSPPYLRHGAQAFGVGVILLAALFVYALIRKEKAIRDLEHAKIGQRLFHRLVQSVDQVAAGMRRIGLSSRFFAGFLIVLLALAMQALAIFLVAHAYGIQLVLWKSAVVLMIIRVGVVIPNAPANLGTYQFFAALGMQLFGVNRYAANGFALVLFVVLMAPTWITGFIALSHSGTNLLRLQHDARNAAGDET